MSEKNILSKGIEFYKAKRYNDALTFFLSLPENSGADNLTLTLTFTLTIIVTDFHMITIVFKCGQVYPTAPALWGGWIRMSDPVCKMGIEIVRCF